MRFSSILLLILFVSCKTTEIQNRKLIYLINKSQKTYVKENFEKKYRFNFNPFAKLAKKVHEKLFEELSQKHQLQMDSVFQFKIIDGFEIDSYHHIGIVWNDDFFFHYSYDIESKEFILKSRKKDLSDYPKDNDIPLHIIDFFDKLEKPNSETKKRAPIRGMSGVYRLLYSNILKSKGGLMIDSFVYSA